MKVLFVSRATLYTNPGGDTIQVRKTAEALEKIGINVAIKLTNDKIEYTSYDLIHFFNIIRPADIIFHIKASGKPYVVSTIFVDYSEYEQKNSTGIKKVIWRLLGADRIEYIKMIGRFILNGESIVSPSYFLKGQKKSIQNIIRKASLLLPNSEHECRRLLARYGVKQQYRVIPNGVNVDLFNASAAAKESNVVLCVARIEPLKNQLNLIKALNNSSFKLLIIGRSSVNHKTYYRKCEIEAHQNVTFVDHVSQEDLVQYYAKAKVHVLPSWFETTGLSSLEAAAMGCNIVITDKGDTKEYFEDMAYYCEPDKPESIRQAVEAASKNPNNEKLRQKILHQFTWDVAAKKTLSAYQEILDQRI